MPADNHVHSPFGLQERRQFKIGVIADVGEQHREVDIIVFISIGNDAHLMGGVVQRNETADQFVLLDRIEDLFRQNPDEHQVESIHMKNQIRFHQAFAVLLNIEVRCDDGKVGHFL